MFHELLLKQMCVMQQEAPEHLDGKTEKMLRQVAIQLRREFGHFIQASSSPMPADELQWPLGVQLAQGAEGSTAEQKDASVQTSAMEGDTLGSGQEGPREAWEEQPPDAAFSAGRRPGEPCRVPRQQATAPTIPRRTERVSFPPVLYLVTYYIQTKHLKITSHPTTLKYLYSLRSPSVCPYPDLHLAHLPLSVASISAPPPSLPRIPVLFYLSVCHDMCRASLLAQMVKNPPECRRRRFNPWIGNIP